MKINKINSILWVIVPPFLLLLVSLFISTFYIDNIISYSEKAKEDLIQKHIKSKKNEGEILVKNFFINVEEKNNKNNKIDEEIKSELKNNLEVAFRSAELIYNKYKNNKSKKDIKERIVDSLTQINLHDNTKHIFIRSFSGKDILSSIPILKNTDLLEYCDVDGRAIILEEITKVRKHNQGYIRTRLSNNSPTQVEMVKYLGFYDWYIGTYIYEVQKKEKKKLETLQSIQNTPIHSSSFIAVYNDKKSIYLSPKMNKIFGDKSLSLISDSLTKETIWHNDKINGYFYYSKYHELFDWHIVYGFNTFDINKKELQRQNSLVKFLNAELKLNLTILLFMILLSALFYATFLKRSTKNK